MKALIIKDLARTEQLDRTEMAAVRGGMKMGMPSYKFGDLSLTQNVDSSTDVEQFLAQKQSVFSSTADGSAFVTDVDSHNTVSQSGTNYNGYGKKP